MQVKDLVEANMFQVITKGDNLETEITKPFCCDLLSFAMSKTPVGSVWVTVMGNVNTLAVASLTEAACIILAEGAVLDETAKAKAEGEGITVMHTEQPIFETALRVKEMLEKKK